MTDDRARIEHMLQGVERIKDAMKDVSEEQFYQSRILLDAMSFNFAILGEAANKVSDGLQAKHPEIPWGDIIGMRNVLIHDYVKPQPKYMLGRIPERPGSPEKASSENSEGALNLFRSASMRTRRLSSREKLYKKRGNGLVISGKCCILYASVFV